MADLALTFADGADAYEIENVQALTGGVDLVSQTSRVPGSSGGFDHYGSEAAPDAVKSLVVSFTVWSATRSGMQAKLDAVAKLAHLGRRKLYLQPEGTANERWCYARVENIRFSRKPAEHTDLIQPVQAYFQVNPPFWYEDEESTAQACSGTSTDLAVTNNGNAIALPRIFVTCGAGQTAENVTIRRMNGADILDEVSYVGVLVASDELMFDCARRAITLNDVAVFADADYDHPDWFRLVPGSNTVRVVFGNAGDAATATVYFNDTFRG